ncbi:iron-sulfur cluster repair di-iron protein [Cytophagales bacterium LB-30]|uniref:Iron-sulfur cluster repair di-iron protein n=1 Tax=Shiella aurantiaca TaxID=3058365 RepID=A0ABT8F3G9_9BACT|nr:iron-sulfur cluster repair di-iron protein [Shiella aurantiaca]MDN4165012.1 iron-sulfur cluster repair di-iron protein [Shiella aurantiaca]
MEISASNTIGEIVAQDYRTALLFEKLGIDFCCKGNRTIEEVCALKHLDKATLLQNLKDLATQSETGSIDYKSWPIDLLADYIEKKHHRYVLESSVVLQQYLDKICSVHGHHHPELHEVNRLFMASIIELKSHMVKEETVLFPYVRKMVRKLNESNDWSLPLFRSVENPIAMMKNEHEVEGERFQQIRALTDDYTPPQDACNTYRVTFSLLKEFEEDLHLHIHLENNILFPRAIEMEQFIVSNL